MIATPSEQADGLTTLANGVQNLHGRASPLLDRASEQAIALARRGADAVRDTSEHLRDRALRASDGAVSYVRDEPVKSMLIAAAAGAALMALAGLLTRSRRH